MQDIIIVNGFLNPLGITIRGTGEYVRNQIEHLVDYFDYMEQEEIESIRQDLQQ